ncbi:hypothetical protein IAR50_002816 [Cryptococcus sp. DSM 104548]
MVSFFSFFSSKKKSKGQSPRPPSPTNSSRDTAERPAARFLSLRQKAITSPHGTSSRRASSELSRRRSQLQSAPSGSQIQLPKLDLGFEVSALGNPAADTALDIGPLGGPASLKQEEKNLLRELRWNVGEIKLAWEWFGAALKATGLDTRGILLPRGIDLDPTTQYYLFALFALCTKPHLIGSLPSVASHLAKPTSERPSEIWRERLVTSLRDTDRPLDISEGLKLIYRRLLPSTAGHDPLISRQVYAKFVQAEHASSYPLSAFGELLGPDVPTEVTSYLHEMFETWAAIATHANQNTLTGGRLAYLLGWWAYGMNTSKVAGFDQFYKDWKEAGKRLEHLLYAWIRYQSTKQKLPTRMLQLVNDYPFGESSASSEHLPLPPPSSSRRRTLHVVLKSSLPVDKVVSGPEEIIQAALQAAIHSEGSAFQWSALAKDKASPAEIVSEDSLSLFQALAPSEEPLSPVSILDLPSAQEPPIYRPFQTHSRGHSVLSSHSTFSKPHAEGEESPDPGLWNDFEKVGFNETGGGVGDLDLNFSAAASAGPSAKPVTSPAQKRKSVERPFGKPRKRTFRDSAELAPTFTVVSEAVVNIDDIFMSFFEDAKLDDVTSSWPPFSLVRLSSPIGQPEPIEWLLVSIEDNSKPPSEPSEPEVVERPTSPSARSFASGRGSNSKGLRDFASSLTRRKSTAGGGAGNSSRRSFFGMSKSGSGLKEGDLPTLEELGKKKPEPVSVGEMGEIVSPSRSPNAKDLATPTTAGKTLVVTREADNVSTQALFVPTPAGTVQNTPLPSPLPTASGYEEGNSLLSAISAISHDGGDRKAVDGKAVEKVSGIEKPAVAIAPATAEEEVSTADQLSEDLAEAESSDDEELPAPSRGERSLAPSPSLPPTIREPETEEEQPGVEVANPGVAVAEAPSVEDKPAEQEESEGVTGLLASGASVIAAGGAMAIGAVAAAANLALSDPETPGSLPPVQFEDDAARENESKEVGSQLEIRDSDRYSEPPKQVMVADEEAPLPKTDLQLKEQRQAEEKGAGVGSLEGAKAAGIALKFLPPQSDEQQAPVSVPHTSEEEEPIVETRRDTHIEGLDVEGRPVPPQQIMVADEEAPLPVSDRELEEQRQAENMGMSLGGIEEAAAAGIASDFHADDQDTQGTEGHSALPDDDKPDYDTVPPPAASAFVAASTIEEREADDFQAQKSSEERHPIEVTVETVATGTPGTERNLHFQPLETSAPVQTELRDDDDVTTGAVDEGTPSAEIKEREEAIASEPVAQVIVADDIPKATAQASSLATENEERPIEQEASALITASQKRLADSTGDEVTANESGSALAADVTGSELPEVTNSSVDSASDKGDIEPVQSLGRKPESDNVENAKEKTVDEKRYSEIVEPEACIQETTSSALPAAEADPTPIKGGVPTEDDSAQDPKDVADDDGIPQTSTVPASQTTDLQDFGNTLASPNHTAMPISGDSPSTEIMVTEESPTNDHPLFSLGSAITSSAGPPLTVEGTNGAERPEMNPVSPGDSRAAESNELLTEDKTDVQYTSDLSSPAVAAAVVSSTGRDVSPSPERTGAHASTDGPERKEGQTSAADSAPTDHFDEEVTPGIKDEFASTLSGVDATADESSQQESLVDTPRPLKGPAEVSDLSEALEPDETNKSLQTPEDGSKVNGTSIPTAGHLENAAHTAKKSDLLPPTPALIRATEAPVILHGTPPGSPPPVNGQAPKSMIPQPLTEGPDDDQPAVLVPIEDASPKEEVEEGIVASFSVPETVDEEAEAEEERIEAIAPSSTEVSEVSNPSDSRALGHDLAKGRVQETATPVHDTDESEERITPSVGASIAGQGDTLAVEDAEVPHDEKTDNEGSDLHQSKVPQEPQ